MEKIISKLVTPSTWAHTVKTVPDDFDQIKMAKTYPFTLDNFQKQAIYYLERGDSVFVAAHTSAGKTVVAEYALALSRQHGTKAIYTSPIKALSNQKYRDFKDAFEGDVGLLTGDTQINPDASCVIMTTEILRSMLYRTSGLISDVEYVIFDEVHYVNDAERGVVWEEVLIMLPPHIQIVLLSATVPNVLEFADWVGRQRKTPIYVVSTYYRPVPLEHHLYCNRELVCIVNKAGFLEEGYKQSLSLIKTGKNAIRNARQQGTLWSDLIYVLKKKTLLPVVVFVFSRRGCEDSADACGSMTLTDASERAAIHMFLEQSMSLLQGTDAELPQILRMREMMERGVAVHHSGLLPILKEAVEILFSRSLIKVLFATETFAMGVNMPARTVVFSATRKHDGNGFRQLTAGEYTQMAGRAGRRGKDTAGTVVIVPPPDEAPSESGLRTMILGAPTRLTSRFRLTYNMILSLLRVESIRIEDMIKRSFGENAAQKSMPLERARLEQLEEELRDIEPLGCPLCQHIETLYELNRRLIKEGSKLFTEIVDSGKASKYFDVGRVVIVRLNGSNCVAMIKGINQDRTLKCMVNVVEQKYLTPVFYISNKPGHLETLNVAPRDILLVTGNKSNEGEYFWEMPKWTETTLPLIGNLDIDTLILQRKDTWNLINSIGYDRCPDWIEHYDQFSYRAQLHNEVAELKFRLSDFGLALLPEYQQRIEVLKTLGYLDVNCAVTLKGRVACEINTVNELVTTEMIFDNAFRDMSIPEMVAILSTMVFQEKDRYEEMDEEPFMSQEYEYLSNLAGNLADVQKQSGILDVSRESTIATLNPSLMRAVHAWANHAPFLQICQLTPVLEGSIVRCIVRLGETVRELRSAGKLIGDPILVQKAERAAEDIKRDICFTTSLYYR